MIVYLSLDEILRLHYQVVEDYGGSHGVRDERHLKSIVAAPSQNVFGEEQYKRLDEKAAVYMRNIIGDHLFIDGNKRTAVTVTGLFLMRNGRQLVADPRALEDFAVAIATDRCDVPAIATWLRQNSR